MKNIVIASFVLTMFVMGLSNIKADDDLGLPKVVVGHSGGIINRTQSGLLHSQSHRSLMGGQQAPIYVFVVPFLGPTTNEVGYKNFTETVLPNIRKNQWYDGWTRLGYQMRPDHIITRTTGSGNSTVWFSVVAWSDGLFNLSNMEIRVKSSDQGNALGKTEDYSKDNYIYHPNSSIGVGDGGEQIASGSWGSQLVREFAYVGTACNTFAGDTQSQVDYAKGWIAKQGNFSINVRVRIRSSGVDYIGEYTLSTRPTPQTPRLVSNKGVMSVIIPGLHWDTWILETKEDINGNWVSQGGYKGDTILPVDQMNSQFFRLAGP